METIVLMYADLKHIPLDAICVSSYNKIYIESTLNLKM